MKAQYTPTQIIDALAEHGGRRLLTAEKLGISMRTIERAITVAKQRGWTIPRPKAPGYDMSDLDAAHAAAPDNYHVKGVSTYYAKDGSISRWIKTDQDAEQRANHLAAAAAALAEKIPRQSAIVAPNRVDENLANVYTITDYHIGMLAWRHEGGADWDLNIAEELLSKSFNALVNQAPRAKIGIVNQLGDFLHTDGFQPLTPTSKHVLDADSRFPKIVQVAIRCGRTLVNRALRRHEQVILNMEEGNHDLASSVWLRALFQALYENEPRVTVLTSPLPYHAVQHGKTMIAFHHGHIKKLDKLPGFMAAQYPEMWGSTTHRYCHTGHLHHVHEKENDGMTVVQHPTLAARDAFAARGGWHADRAAQAITYHAEYGQVARNLITPEMVQ